MSEIVREFTYMIVCRGEEKPKTHTYIIRSKSEGLRLGRIAWYVPWRQYCFEPDSNVVFNSGCLRDLKSFLDQVNDERVAQLNAERRKFINERR